MTIKQFKDMLYALKIPISPPEMHLIIDKFMAYSYMIDPESSDGVPVNAGYNLYISFLLIILLLFKYDLFIIQ